MKRLLLERRRQPGYDGWGLQTPRNVSSMRMPRWASRLTRLLTAVRLERVQEISEDDARAEGCDGNCPIGYLPAHGAGPLSYQFAQIWESLNVKRGYGWETNSWVWVLGFAVITRNVDDVLADSRRAA